MKWHFKFHYADYKCILSSNHQHLSMSFEKKAVRKCQLLNYDDVRNDWLRKKLRPKSSKSYKQKVLNTVASVEEIL